MENSNEIIEIKVKALFLGEFKDWDSWIANVNKCGQQFGVTQQLFHQDRNGFKTSGYDLRNTEHSKVYPVKTYLLVTDPDKNKPTPFKSK